MHHLAYLEMIIPRKRERREKTEREKNLSYRDVEWEKLVHGDLLKKQRVWHLKRNYSKKGKLNLVTAHIQLSATIQSVCTTKDASSFGANSSSEAREENSLHYVVQKVGSDSSENDEWKWWWWRWGQYIFAKLASNSWNDSDIIVPLSVLAKHSC